jgi:hypothetical protein
LAKRLVNSFLANRIYYATVKKDHTMSDYDRKDVTEQAIQAVILHMEKLKKDTGKNVYHIDGLGMIKFTPEAELSEEDLIKIGRKSSEKKEAEEN